MSSGSIIRRPRLPRDARDRHERPPRRIVTGHDASGSSVVLSDAPTPKTLDIGTAVFHELWATDADARADRGRRARADRPPAAHPAARDGVVVRFTEMSPGAAAPMHRTESVDIGVVLDGETWLILDDGSETRMAAGDVVVQRGTNHSWEPLRAVVRMAFLMIDGTITERARDHRPAEFFDAVLD